MKQTSLEVATIKPTVDRLAVLEVAIGEESVKRWDPVNQPVKY